MFPKKTLFMSIAAVSLLACALRFAFPTTAKSESIDIATGQSSRIIYKFQYKLDGEANLMPIAAGAPGTVPINFETNGKIVLDMETKADGKAVRGRLLLDNFQAPEGLWESRGESLKNELDQTHFSFDILPDSGVQDLKYAGLPSGSSRGLIQNLILALPMPMIQDANEERQEWDANGQVSVRYAKSRLSEGTLTLQKSKMSYATRDQGPEIHIKKSESTIVGKVSDLLVETVSLVEDLGFQRSGKQVGRSFITLSLNRDSQASLSAAQLASLQSSFPAGRFQNDRELRQNDEQNLRQQMAVNRLEGKSLEDLLHMDKERAEGKRVDETDLARKLAAFARLHPESCLQLVDALNGRPRDDFLFHAILVALAEANHEKSQEALVELVQRRSTDHAALMGIYGAFQHIEEPKSLLLQAAKDAFQKDPHADVREAGGLAIGTIAGRLGGTIAKEQADIWVSEFEDAGKAGKIFLLRQLGNLGHSDLFPFLRTVAEGSDEDLRDYAIRSMRFVNDKGVDQFLLSLIKLSQDRDELSAAMTALHEREAHADTIEAYGILLQREGPEPNQKLEALDSIIALSPSKDLTKRFLQQIPSEQLPHKVQKAINDYLQRR